MSMYTLTQAHIHMHTQRRGEVKERERETLNFKKCKENTRKTKVYPQKWLSVLPCMILYCTNFVIFSFFMNDWTLQSNRKQLLIN